MLQLDERLCPRPILLRDRVDPQKELAQIRIPRPKIVRRGAIGGGGATRDPLQGPQMSQGTVHERKSTAERNKQEEDHEPGPTVPEERRNLRDPGRFAQNELDEEHVSRAQEQCREHA